MNIYKKTTHEAIIGDSRKRNLKKESVDLVITSPPYPMIEMWDDIFKSMNPKINLSNPKEAFHLMNLEMKKVYKQMYISLKIGGIMVINIGDATRKINNKFKLYPNAAKTIMMCEDIGFDTLPQIHWWKPTNSPNKFMGSGMLPVGAYVTLENEHILIFRKGIREYTEKQKEERRISAFFQNERNIWFSDIWRNVFGEKQNVIGLGRKRNAAYPFELAYRLINMFSVKGDLVVDPFGGTGTTSVASLASGRSSKIFDIDETFINHSLKRISNINIDNINKIIDKRYKTAISAAKEKLKLKNKKPKYFLENGDPIYTMQERKIKLPKIIDIKYIKNIIHCEYK